MRNGDDMPDDMLYDVQPLRFTDTEFEFAEWARYQRESLLKSSVIPAELVIHPKLTPEEHERQKAEWMERYHGIATAPKLFGIPPALIGEP